MKIAVIAVRVVKGASDGEVGVVAVRDGLVAAAGPVPVAALDRRAGAGTAPVDVEAVLVGVPLVGSVEMPVVQEVRVVAVADLPMAAAATVPMLVVLVLAAGHRRLAGSSRDGGPTSILPAGVKISLRGAVMSEVAADPVRTLLSTDDPVKLRQGLALIREEIARVGSREARPLFELVSMLFYIDPLDRPDLLPVLDEAVDLVVGFGDWVIPALVEKLDAGDVKAQIAAGHALGRIGADAIRPLIEEYTVAADDSHRAFILYALGKIRSAKVLAAAGLALEAAASPDLELRDTATRVLGRFCEVIPPAEMPEAVRREVLSRLEANVADRNTGVRAKAIRSLGKMARQGHLRPEEREALKKACHRIVGDDEAFDWDPAFIIRREAEEALRYI